MRTILIAALVTLTGAGAAAADTIAVTPEPAGPNCPAGGVKITVVPTPPTPPADPLPDQISYVCAGVAGVDGQPGTPGADGQDGSNGSDGLDGLDGQDGSNGFDGSDGSSSSSNSGSPSSTRIPSCGKASRVVSWRLPKRFRRVTSATVIVGGHRRVVLVERGTVLVDLHGLACGSYPIIVQRRGVRSTVRVFTLQRSGRVGQAPVVG